MRAKHKLTTTQLKKFSEYLELLRNEFLITSDLVPHVEKLSGRKQLFIERNSRNYIHAINILGHYVLSRTPGTGVKFSDRPDFRKTKDVQTVVSKKKDIEIIRKQQKICESSIRALRK